MKVLAFLKLLLIAALIAFLGRLSTDVLCRWLPSDCAVIEKLVVAVLIVPFVYFVLGPFAKLVGISVKK
jgi:hypothetical protein